MNLKFMQKTQQIHLDLECKSSVGKTGFFLFQIVYSEFLRTLREKPKLLATCLTLGDKLGIPCMGEVVNTVFSGIYGNCLLTEDEHILLKLLHDLMRLQLTAAPNPRKLLRQGNCSFSRLYKV